MSDEAENAYACGVADGRDQILALLRETTGGIELAAALAFQRRYANATVNPADVRNMLAAVADAIEAAA